MSAVSVPTSTNNTGWQKLSAIAGDIKISHSIFALPWAILSTVLASTRTTNGLRLGQILLIIACMVTARSVAMMANRILDADVDAGNARTARRAIPAGKVSAGFMIGTLIVTALLFIAATFLFYVIYKNPWPVMLSLPVLAFLSAYPLLKRFSELCHYYLGAALALAPLCAWLAIKGSMNLPPVLMAATVLLWTAGFDIIYACQDYAFDVSAKLHSVPAKLGIANALWVARFTHVLSASCLITLGLMTPEFHLFYWVGTGIAIGLLIIEHSLVKANDLSKVGLAFFTINGIISVVLGTLGVIDILIR